MKSRVGSTVHPWYRGTHEWQVTGIAQLEKPIEYRDPVQVRVSYDPKIILLESQGIGKALWFPYWIATSKTGGKMKWGQRPPVLEEEVFLELLKDAIRQGFFSKTFLKELARELELMLK